MIFLFKVLKTQTFVPFLLLFGNEGISFGIYEIKKSLTPLGWATVVVFPTVLIFGAIYIAVKIFKKPKIK